MLMADEVPYLTFFGHRLLGQPLMAWGAGRLSTFDISSSHSCASGLASWCCDDAHMQTCAGHCVDSFWMLLTECDHPPLVREVPSLTWILIVVTGLNSENDLSGFPPRSASLCLLGHLIDKSYFPFHFSRTHERSIYALLLTLISALAKPL